MIKRLKNFTLQLIAGANVATIVLMLLVGYSDRLNPADFPRLSNVGLVFPLFVIINLAFLVFWLMFKKRWSLIPILGMLVCYSPMRTYCPLNLPKTVTDSALTVLSFNVYYGKTQTKDGTKERVVEYLRKMDADIVCLQEIYFTDDDYAEMKSLYPYSSAFYGSGGTAYITTLSRYPILKRETVGDDTKGRHSVATFVNIGGDTVIVVNNHLASTRLTSGDSQNFKKIIEGKFSRDSATIASTKIAEKLSKSTLKRAVQVDSLVNYLHRHQDNSIILCGDFNDSPISHSHRAMANLLTDCYRESGNGPGISYHDNRFYVRIDHIFCSADWKPYECFVDSKTDLSDHYPIVCRLKNERKH